MVEKDSRKVKSLADKQINFTSSREELLTRLKKWKKDQDLRDLFGKMLYSKIKGLADNMLEWLFKKELRLGKKRRIYSGKRRRTRQKILPQSCSRT
jgi:hypothetical protein